MLPFGPLPAAVLLPVLVTVQSVPPAGNAYGCIHVAGSAGAAGIGVGVDPAPVVGPGKVVILIVGPGALSTPAVTPVT